MNFTSRARTRFVYLLTLLLATSMVAKEDKRPNVLFAFADDWGWPHAGAYGDPVVKTPTFDRLAKEGALFHHAYVSSPSCTPSRGAVLTGQYHWRLEGAGNLWSVFPDKFDTYPELIGKSGYATGVSSKGWGPGRTETGGRQLVGARFKNFTAFLKQKPKGKPFCYWLGSSDPHRGYAKGSGKKSGMDLSKIKLFAHYPDSPEIRGDVADYYFEVQRFDRLVGAAIKALEECSELDNTIIVMSGDHGMPFPRCKSNNYDSGARIPLAIRWPAKIKAGTVINDFVSLTDVAPTFYETVGVKIPADVTGRSMLGLLAGKDNGDRSFVIHGKERHVPGQEKPDMGGYPTRAIRTHDFLYLHNFKPNRWPAGTPHYKKASVGNAWLADCDNGPTKTYMVQNRDKDAHHRKLYDLAFGKRPADELYDLKKDPGQLVNVASDPAYAETVKKLKDQLFAELRKTGDPRVTGKGADFDKFPYLGGAPKFQGPKKK
ncbi:MAG: heparan N-sulfatase [Opitutae bacterium]|nr:heparan N-sulfatase [Opitutae bacterium]